MQTCCSVVSVCIYTDVIKHMAMMVISVSVYRVQRLSGGWIVFLQAVLVSCCFLYVEPRAFVHPPISIHPCVCLSIETCALLFTYPSICLAVYQSIYLFIHPGIYPPVCLFICLSLHLSLSNCPFLHLSVLPSF